MLKKLLTIMILSLFLANLVTPVAKAADDFPVDQFPYTEMQIQVMPEFDYPEKWSKDEPSLLLGYYGTFVNKSGADYNGEIEFPVPLKDKDFQIYIVAEFPADKDSEVQRQYEINKEKNVVTWKPTKPIKNGETYSFVVEYYTNPFKAGAKEFAYEFINPAKIDKLEVFAYVPVNAKNFAIEPKASQTTQSDFGQEIHYYVYSNVEKGTKTNLKVSYVKEDNESTLSILSKQNPPNDENHNGVSATEQVTNNDRPIIGTGGAIVIGISIIIAAVFVYLGLKSSKAASKPVVRKKSKSEQPKQSKRNPEEQKKKLRSLLLDGKIDEDTYEKELKKLG